MNLEQIKALIIKKEQLLEDLRAKKKSLDNNDNQAERYRIGANAVRELDPDRAMNYEKMADQLDANEADNKITSDMNPQTIRMKLFSSANSMSNQMSKMTQGSTNFKRAKRMQDWMYEESNKENPTLRMPLWVINNTEKPVTPSVGGNTTIDPTSLEVQTKVTAIETPVAKTKLNNLKNDTTISDNSVQRGGDVSMIPGDWYEMQVVDGYEKPVLRHPNIRLNTMPTDVLDRYNTALKDWKNNNNTAKKSASNKRQHADAKAWLKTFYNNNTFIKDNISRVKTGYDQLNSMITQYNNGDYAAINIQPFKTTMGAMQQGEYNISSNNKNAAKLKVIPFIGEALAEISTLNSFNNVKDATYNLKEGIKLFNKIKDFLKPENFKPPGPDNINKDIFTNEFNNSSTTQGFYNLPAVSENAMNDMSGTKGAVVKDFDLGGANDNESKIIKTKRRSATLEDF